MPVSDLSAEGRRSWEEVSVLLTVTPLDTGPASFNHRILGTGEAYRRAESRHGDICCTSWPLMYTLIVCCTS